MSSTNPTSRAVRNPHAISSQQSLSTLVEELIAARMRTFLGSNQLDGNDFNPDDAFATLAYGARIAREVTSGRWCVVADLLRAHAVESWAELGVAMDLSEFEARDGFHDWISRQRGLRHDTGCIGLTDTEADNLYALAEAVTW